MNDHGGYVLSFRRKWDNPVFQNKQEAAVWAWMCDVAQFQDGALPTKFGLIPLRRGELIMAERELADDFGLHRNVLRRLIQRMIDDGMIELIRDRCPQRAGTVVRICNYTTYQTLSVVASATGPQNGPEKDHNRDRKQDRKRTGNGLANTDADQGLAADFSDAKDRKRTAKGPQNKPETDRKKDQEQVSKTLTNNQVSCERGERGAGENPTRPDPNEPELLRAIRESQEAEAAAPPLADPETPRPETDAGNVVRLSAARPARATRWPVGQEVPPDWIEEAHRKRADKGLPRADLAHEAQEFVKYFTGPEAAKPAKKDWHHAFVQTWCFRQWVKLDRAPKPAAPPPRRSHNRNVLDDLRAEAAR